MPKDIPYSELVILYKKIEKTAKRLEKTRILADFLKKTPDELLEPVILLIQGRLFPKWDKKKLGFSSKLAIKAIAKMSGLPEKKINDLWREKGDLGIVASELVSKRTQTTLFSDNLKLKEVFYTLRRLPQLEGYGSVDKKVSVVSGLLSRASPDEARYLLRTLLEELRVGVADGTIRDAITWAFITEPPSSGTNDRTAYNEILGIVQAAFDRCNDFVKVAAAAKKGVESLKSIKIEVGIPIRVMLAQREPTVSAALNRVGRPAAIEYKYDGFRMEIHKSGQKVILFTRRLEDVTPQFPDVVEAINKHIKADSCIIDSEAVGLNAITGKYTPFQEISRRIKRKYEIEKLSSELSIELNLFDILYLDGKELLNKEFIERRSLLRSLLPKDIPKVIRLSSYLKSSDDSEAERFYKQSLEAGNEGVMVKKLNSPYTPGLRVGHMIKVKPSLDTLDLVIVGAEWGEGKRSGWLTSFTLACYDPVNDNFLTIGKVGTGLKELDQRNAVTFETLTKLLKDEIIKQDGREVMVRPSVVIEVKFEEIQKSPTYSSGYALRFPRVVGLRPDRSPESAADIDEVKEAFKNQNRKKV